MLIDINLINRAKNALVQRNSITILFLERNTRKKGNILCHVAISKSFPSTCQRQTPT